MKGGGRCCGGCGARENVTRETKRQDERFQLDPEREKKEKGRLHRRAKEGKGGYQTTSQTTETGNCETDSANPIPTVIAERVKMT